VKFPLRVEVYEMELKFPLMDPAAGVPLIVELKKYII
jgi:hypothetical protein